MNDYEKQALDFLTDTGTTLDILWSECRPYFLGDKEARNVYEFTLRNKNGEYTATFGDSIVNTKANNRPTYYDVLSCLSTFDGSFLDFCSDFGYDEDSFKARKIYNEVMRQSDALKRLFSADELAMLEDIN